MDIYQKEAIEHGTWFFDSDGDIYIVVVVLPNRWVGIGLGKSPDEAVYDVDEIEVQCNDPKYCVANALRQAEAKNWISNPIDLDPIATPALSEVA